MIGKRGEDVHLCECEPVEYNDVDVYCIQDKHIGGRNITNE